MIDTASSLPLDHTLKSKLESICHSHTYLHWHLGILSTCGAVDCACIQCYNMFCLSNRNSLAQLEITVGW